MIVLQRGFERSEATRYAQANGKGNANGNKNINGKQNPVRWADQHVGRGEAEEGKRIKSGPRVCQT